MNKLIQIGACAWVRPEKIIGAVCDSAGADTVVIYLEGTGKYEHAVTIVVREHEWRTFLEEHGAALSI